MDADTREKIWLIYSREHNAWWGPNHCGYVLESDGAGRYTKDEADKICADACRGRGACGDDGVPEFAMLAPASADEAERMREALEKISGYSNEFIDDHYQIDEMKGIASTALRSPT